MLNLNQISEISQTPINVISKRGIATKLIGALKRRGVDAATASRICWCIGKKIIENSLEVTPEVIQRELAKEFITDVPGSTTRVNGKEMDAEGLSIANNTQISISERVRQLIHLGYSLTRIASSIKSLKDPNKTISYARVKHVKIADAIKRFSQLSNENQLKDACNRENFKIGGRVYQRSLTLIATAGS